MIPAHTRAKIIKTLKRNPNSFAVSKKFKSVSPETVRTIARRLGMPPLRAIKFTDKDRAALAEALRQNPNCGAVARAHGDISEETVRAIALEYGIKLHRQGRPKKTSAGTGAKN